MPKNILLLILLIGLTIFLSTLLVGNDPFGARDFLAFWSGGRVFLEGGNPYNDATLKSAQVINSWNKGLHSSYTQQFFNPSWTLSFFSLLGFLPFKIATVFWIFIGLLSFIFSVKFLSETLKSDKKLILVGSILFIYAWYSLMVGQLSLFILFLLLFGICNFEKNGPTWKSAIGTVGIFLKPHLFIPLVIWGLLNLGKRDFRMLGIKSLVILISLIILSEISHPGITSLWINREGIPTQWISSTPAALLQLYFLKPEGPPVWPLFLMPVLGIISGLFLYFKNPKSTLSESFPILLFLGVFFAPYAFPYDFVLYLPLILKVALKEKSIISSYAILLLPLLSSIVASSISNELQYGVILSFSCIVLLLLRHKACVS